MTPIFKHIVILSDSEGSSSKSMATIQGEEDASYLSMTKGQIAQLIQRPRFLPTRDDDQKLKAQKKR